VDVTTRFRHLCCLFIPSLASSLLFLLSPCCLAPSRFVSAFSTPSFLFRFLPSFFFPAPPPTTNVAPSSASCASESCSGTVSAGGQWRSVEWQRQRRPADGLPSSPRSSRPPTSWTCGSGRWHPWGVAVWGLIGCVRGRASRLAYREPIGVGTEPMIESQAAIRPGSPRARPHLTTLAVSRRGILHDGYKKRAR